MTQKQVISIKWMSKTPEVAAQSFNDQSASEKSLLSWVFWAGVGVHGNDSMIELCFIGPVMCTQACVHIYMHLYAH